MVKPLRLSLEASIGYLDDAGRERVKEALELASWAHRNDRRRSGEPYITHPVAVAELLAEMRLDADALIAGLLHDTVEDTELSFATIEERFGTVVKRIVEGETKISKLGKFAARTHEEEQAENLRQMLLAMVSDVRIILVKFADRLHNMRTLEHMPRHKQVRNAQETLEIFAPLAHRLGISHIKNELEELSFRYLEPERYQALERLVRTRHAEREAYVQQSIELLQQRLGQEGLQVEVSGRSKQLYSIYRKMQRDGKTLDQIFDLMAIRAILKAHENGSAMSPEDKEKAVCYRALGIVHSIWTPIPGRFKDYVAVPKPNGYQSLHTTIIGQHGLPIEVQIRTRRMHEVAEYGVAAHWAYKQGIDDADEIQKRLEWMKQLLDMDNTVESAGAFIDAVKSDVLSERVLVFTPAGDVIDLPRGSTPIDFAYHIHTQVGHRCIGARVNGEIVPLGYQLKTGDRVEVLTNRNPKYGPSNDWLNIVATRSAKQKIRQYFRQQAREEQVELGRRTLERALRRRQLPVASLTSKGKLEQTARKLVNGETADELLLALSNKRITAKQVVEALAPDTAQKAPSPKTPPVREPKRGPGGIYLDGIDAPAKLSQCCSPVRGDDVVGYITRGRGVSVHRVDCPNVKHLMQKDSDRVVNITWDAPSGEVYPADFEIIAVDRPGLLKDVLDVIANMNKSASRVDADVQDSSHARIHFRVDVRDQVEVDFIKDNVLRIPDVTRIYRAKPGIKL